HGLCIRIDNPHDLDAAIQIFFNCLTNVLLFVVRGEDLHCENGRAVDKTGFLRSLGGLLWRGQGNVNADVSFWVRRNAEISLSRVDSAPRTALGLQPQL